MTPIKKVFEFKTQMSLVMFTGLRATNLVELKEGLKTAGEASVYYHTHHFLQQHQFLAPEPPNDFAYWVSHVLGEPFIGEQLAAIDTVRFRSLSDLRNALVQTMESFLATNPILRDALSGQEFHFMKCILFDLPTPYKASTLEEFLEGLRKVSIRSIYYHVFEGRLRTVQGMSDFSLWFRDHGEGALADQVEKLDPYTQTLEGLRRRLIRMVERRIGEEAHATAGSV